MHILIITITPIVPTAFFNIPTQPITASVASPRIFPTTGIEVETTAFVVLAVTPSTVCVKLPSKDKTVTKKVIIIPIIHIEDDLKNFASFPTWISLDILDTIPSAVPIKTNGNMKLVMILPTKFINSNRIGLRTPAVVIEPVVNINVINIGIKLLEKPTKSCIVFFMFEIMFEKFVKTKVAISMYCTKYVILDTFLFSKFWLIELNILWITIITTIIPIVPIVSFSSFPKTFKTEFIILLFPIFPVLALWLGIMNIAKTSGLLNVLSNFFKPILSVLFPEIPKNHESLGYISSNVVVNMLGLGSAATPFGLKAMKSLQELNPKKDTATKSMITFLILNTSGLTLVPTTVISLRLLHGSTNPTEIVFATILATIISTIVALFIDKIFRKVYK